MSTIKKGDTVTTPFFPKESHAHRLVLSVERYKGHSESGYKVTTIDDKGRKISCDANWYTRVVT